MPGWCATCGKDVPSGARDCAHCEQWWKDNQPPWSLSGWWYWTWRRWLCRMIGHAPHEYSEQGGPHIICDRCSVSLN